LNLIVLIAFFLPIFAPPTVKSFRRLYASLCAIGLLLLLLQLWRR